VRTKKQYHASRLAKIEKLARSKTCRVDARRISSTANRKGTRKVVEAVKRRTEKMSTEKLIRHSSESAEHYTPSDIVERARRVMEHIDLDPASCAEANKWIRADRIFTRKDDGFTRPWSGRVFLNPPGGLSDNRQHPVKPKCRETGSCGLPPGHTHEGVESSQKKWWFKLAREFKSGAVISAVFVSFSIELLQSTQVDPPDGLPLPLDFPICFPSRRISYLKPGGEVGSQPPHASAIIFLGSRAGSFSKEFSYLGRVKS
jgi:hypothetical protein